MASSTTPGVTTCAGTRAPAWKPIDTSRGLLLRAMYTTSWPSSTLTLTVSPLAIDSRWMKGCTSRGSRAEPR